MDVRAGPLRRLSTEELMLLNCGAVEDSWESLGLHRDQTSQLILEEIIAEYSLEGLMLKLKLQYFSHLIWRADSLKKTLMLGKIEGKRRRGVAEDEMVGWHHWLIGHKSEKTPGDSGGQRSLECYSPWGTKIQTWLSNSTTTSFNRSDYAGKGHKTYIRNTDIYPPRKERQADVP